MFEEEISASSVRGKIPCYSLEAIVSENSRGVPGGEKEQEEEEYLIVFQRVSLFVLLFLRNLKFVAGMAQ